jgi:hypothetical protein
VDNKLLYEKEEIYMLYLLIWIVVGLIAIFATAGIHLWTAEKMGYKALEWWDNYTPNLYASYTGNLPLDVMIGVLIWPVRIIQFSLNLKDYFSMYDLYDEEEI